MKISFQMDDGQSYQLVKVGSLWDIPLKSNSGLLKCC